MTTELGVEHISFDEDALEIILKDVGGAFDGDQRRFLRERGESRYQSLLVIERDPARETLMGDLDALQSYPKGVYVLITTKLDSQNKWRVFVGMTGSNEEILDIYRRATDINMSVGVNGHSLSLTQCLEEQNKKCPPSMSNWDLAVVIPEEKNVFFLFSALLSIFKKAEGFAQYKALNSKVSLDLSAMHSAYHYLFGNPKTRAMLYHPALFISDPDFWNSILGFVALLPRAIKAWNWLRDRRERRKAEKLEGKYTIPQKSGDINNKNKGDSNATFNATGDINISIVINVSAEYLNENLPRE